MDLRISAGDLERQCREALAHHLTALQTEGFRNPVRRFLDHYDKTSTDIGLIAQLLWYDLSMYNRRLNVDFTGLGGSFPGPASLGDLMRSLKPFIDSQWADLVVNTAIPLPLDKSWDDLRAKLIDEWVHVISHAVFSPLHCREINEWDFDPSTFQGFVDLRPGKCTNPIAMGLLASPYEGNSVNKVITGQYDSPFGVASDRADYIVRQPNSGKPVIESGLDPNLSFYVSHDESRGAECTQACIAIAAGLLSDGRGAVIPATFETTCLKIPPIDSGTSADFSPKDVRNVIEEHCNLNAFESELGRRLHTNVEWKEDVEFFTALVKAHIDARYPVILFCDERRLSSDLLCIFTADPSGSDNQFKHCVTIVGYSEESKPGDEAIAFLDDDHERFHSETVSHLILHDPGTGPFVKMALEDCLHAASCYDKDGSIYSIFVTDKTIELNASECYDRIEHVIDWKTETLDIRLVPFGDIPDILEVTGNMIDDLSHVDGNENGKEKLLRLLRAATFPRDNMVWFFLVTRKNTHEIVGIWIFDTKVMSGIGRFWKSYRRQVAVGFHEDAARLIRRHDYAIEFQEIRPKKGHRETRPSSSVHLTPKSSRDHLLGGLDDFRPSVMTSSTGLNLRDLVPEFIHRHASDRFVKDFELFMFRNRDFKGWLDSLRAEERFFISQDEHTKLRNNLDNGDGSLTDILCHARFDDYRDNLVEWVAKAFRMNTWGNDVQAKMRRRGLERANISAFATHLSRIADDDDSVRKREIEILFECAKIAILLKTREDVVEGPVILEIVCGTIFAIDRNVANPYNPQSVQHRDENAALMLLAESLDSLVRKIEDYVKCNNIDIEWYLAIEYEPGHTFLVNTFERTKALQKLLDDNKLSPHVKWNCDMAHTFACMEDKTEVFLDTFADKIVNVHVSRFFDDNNPETMPKIHFRDLPLSHLSNIEKSNIRFVLERIHESKPNGVPIGVSVEQEGCPCSSWVVESLEKLC